MKVNLCFLEIRSRILSGRVDDAIVLLRTHFPSVLHENDSGSASNSRTADPRPSSSNNIEYVSSTSTEPAHLILNLRILAFSEACRTVPLEYPPSTHSALTNSISAPADVEDNPDSQQMALLTTAQKLYALSNTLPNPVDRATYLKELENVGGLLAYKVPENSSMAKYLTLERREAVADQINRAILSKSNIHKFVSILEYGCRHDKASSCLFPGAVDPTYACFMAVRTSAWGKISSRCCFTSKKLQSGFLDR